MGKMIKRILGALGLMAMLFWGYMNYKEEDFFSVNLVQLLTIAISIFIAFYVVQFLTDKRRKVDIIIGILEEIQKDIDTNEIYDNSENVNRKLISITIKAKHLKDYSFSETKESMKTISDHCVEMRTLFDNHRNNFEEIKPDFNRHREIVMNEIDKVKLVLCDI